MCLSWGFKAFNACLPPTPDMADPIGAGLGAASLTVQLLGGCVKGTSEIAMAESNAVSDMLIRG